MVTLVGPLTTGLAVVFLSREKLLGRRPLKRCGCGGFPVLASRDFVCANLASLPLLYPPLNSGREKRML